MPPRSGQLDQISEAIGELRGMVQALDRYNHDKEHSIVDLRGMVNGLSIQLTKEIAAAKVEISVGVSTAIEKVEARLQIIDERVTVLEKANVKDDAQRSVWVEILKSPIVAGIIGGILGYIGAALSLLTGKSH